ncbi:MAG: hypothetical protein KF752_03350 [Pirellulaceae bacterium]|nr:hypothetical protein [Pirellulaceae bacterium]
MTQRERILAIVVGMLFAAIGANYGLGKMRSVLVQKEDRADAAAAQLEALERTISAGQRASNALTKLANKSLPGNSEAAQQQYKDWLYELAEQSGLSQIKVTATGTPERVVPKNQTLVTKEAYIGYTFTLDGKCSLEQLVDLLGKYYDRDYLHRINLLKVTPLKDFRQVAVTLQSQAMALADANPQLSPSLESSGRLALTIDQYKSQILQRNPFAPQNQPPVFQTASSHKPVIGQAWQLALQASDPEGNAVAFELVTDVAALPEGMTYQNGQLRWQPTTKADHKIVVRAVDDGWPRRQAEMTLSISSVEPPAQPQPAPTLDPAQQAYLTGIVRGRTGAQGWIRSRAEGLSIDIYEGADIKIGSVSAKVIQINAKEDFVELESEGKRWTVDMNTSLAEAFRNRQLD